MHFAVPYLPIPPQVARARERRSRRLPYRVEWVLGILSNLLCSMTLVALLIWLGREMWEDLTH